MQKPPFCWCHDDQLPDALIPADTSTPPDAAPQEPQDGAQGTCSWDELLYLMTRGELGTKPRAL